MHFLMVLVLIALLAMAFVSANPFPHPNGEVIVIVNPKVPDGFYSINMRVLLLIAVLALLAISGVMPLRRHKNRPTIPPLPKWPKGGGPGPVIGHLPPLKKHGKIHRNIS
ncbi:uncharacterized protein LOC26526450 [Drosophila erecta]|uniref:uncharacterized protein LOC26526450 n=1 Tax=Drosophila erecta TaxID=7220 RepID=UPI000F05EF42|nr:uncharacterized protein LOC26526450 [Drosophila erecta]